MIDLRRIFRRTPPVPHDVFGFAVIGLGRIAEHFLDAVADSPTVRATALVSGNSSKAERLAGRYGVGFTCGYGEIASLRDRPDVHAVYLALPVNMHREFTAHAAMAGKHVLVEKPMAATAGDCRAMIASCRAAGVLLSVAYRCPYDPLHQRVRGLVQAGALGKIGRLESTFGFVLGADDWRRDKAVAGGGSLYDLGIYSLNAARYFLGEEPVGESAAATVDTSGLETSIDWTSRFDSGAEAHCRSSYLEKLPDTFTLQGSAGELRLEPAFSHRERFHLRGWLTDVDTGTQTNLDEFTSPDTPSHFRLEAEALASTARFGALLPTPGEDGLRDIVAMERIYAAAGVAIHDAGIS